MGDMTKGDSLQESWGRFLFSVAKEVPKDRFEAFREETNQICKKYLSPAPASQSPPPQPGPSSSSADPNLSQISGLSGLSNIFGSTGGTPPQLQPLLRGSSQATSMVSTRTHLYP